MKQFCDVALPVPLDRTFTYELRGQEAEVGARVMVPFGGQRLIGVVMRVHHDAPDAAVEMKAVDRVMDEAALLPDELLELGKWIATYYCAPLGEVLRGMMPLTAEVKRQWTYRIGEAGRRVLNDAARGEFAPLQAHGRRSEPGVRRSQLSRVRRTRESLRHSQCDDGEEGAA